ncbi:MAG: histidine triad nucleotide-binding protein [Deltaproteobacteria bacterium CG_4_9_14_3_um_filter_63_12]|nr:MAG: histidine triad nucleotide-binding protein [Deltaproteobacteria bacterium CG_4_9_14_3_um_filter_63_12]
MADTIFAKIIRGEIPAQKVFEDDAMIAIRDVAPAAPTHILVLPKKPLVNIADADESDALLLGSMLLRAAAIARDEGFSESGYRLVFNINKDGGQSVPHLHLHVLAGRSLGWPPG